MFKLNLGSLPPKSTTPSSSEPSSSASTPVDEQQQAPITSRIDSSSTDAILRLNMSSLSQLRNGKLTDQHYQNNNDNHDPIDDDDDNDDGDDDDEQHEESGGDNEDEIRTTLMPKLQLNLSSMKLSNASIAAAAASNATTTAMVDEETLSNSNNNHSDNNQVKTNNKRIVTVDLIVPQFCKCVVESSDSTNEYNQVKQHIENKWLKTQQRSNEQNQNCNTTTTTNDVDDDDDKKSIKPNISLYKIQSIDANNNSSSVDDETLACSLTLPIIMDTTNGDTSDLNPQQLSIFTVSSLNELIAQNQSLTIKYQKAMSALMEYSAQNQSLKQELSQNKKQIEELNRTRLEMRTLVDSLMHQHQLLAQSMLSTSAASHHQHPTASEPMVKTIPVPQPSKKNRKKKRTIKRKEQQKAAQQQQQQPQQQQSSQNKNKK